MSKNPALAPFVTKKTTSAPSAAAVTNEAVASAEKPDFSTPALESWEDIPEIDPVEEEAFDNTVEVETDENAIPMLTELDDDVRATLPDVTIATHIYAPEPRHRIVSINGKRMPQGTRIEAGLTLEEITAEGIVLNYKGLRYRIAVVQWWDDY
tara:strand:+ start:58 stop:516 length:459 start_codon:yes stop_codon:yes gene_type:complete